MNKRNRHVCLVVLGQAGCLAVGLAMQQRFLVSSVELSAVNRAFDQFELEADRIAASLEKPASQPTDDSPAHLVSAMSAAGLAEAHATLTGPTWEVTSSTAFKGTGGVLHWKQPPAPREGTGTHLAGILDMREGPHLAVAARLGSEGDYLLLHRSKSQVEAEARSLLGSVAALSLLTFVWTWALLGVLAYMLLARFHDQAEKERARSVAEGMRQRQDLIRTRDAVVFGLAKLADSRDPETGDHLERISVYSTMLATVLRQHPKYGKQVTPAFVRLIGISSALHDIGKVGVEDDILLKPGPLTSDERVRMQLHPLIGGDCLREIEQRLGSSNFLQMAREIALAHHERWDGTGYPNGLRGEEIPLSARIVAIADVYDALSCRRVYKDPQAHEQCVEIIRKAAGTQFDPDLVEAWLTITPKFAEVSQRYCAFEVARRKHELDEKNRQTESQVVGKEDRERLAPATVG
jgi:response regulator RpfG family c-di-GMP phosphodiesterase